MRFLCALFAVAFAAAPLQAAPMPASYSLADAGCMIPVKDQGALGACWSFSATTVFETSLVRRGLLTVPEAGNLVSEWDMAVHAGEKITLQPPYGQRDWGSGPASAVGYFVRGFGSWKVADIKNPVGGGPVAVASSPRDVFPLKAVNRNDDLRPYAPPANQPLANFRLRQVLEFADEHAVNGRPASRAFRDRLKRAILRYGALDINMNANNLLGATNTMDTKYDTYAFTGKSPATDHDVTIIGWNDDVPVYDHRHVLLGTGAWLIENSWGASDFTAKDAVPKPDGCFWLGYCDTAAAKYAAAYVTERRRGISDTVLQNQIYNYDGATRAGSAPGQATLAAQRLTAQADTKLLAVGIWTVADRCTIDLAIYSAWNGNGPAGRLLASRKDVLVPVRGYVEIPLPSSVPLGAGQRVYVVIDFGKRIVAPLALDVRSLKVRGFDPHDLQWISSDGESWLSFSGSDKAKGIFFLKGIVGGGRVPAGGATLNVTGLERPIVTQGGPVTLRGTKSFNTEDVLWRVGKGPVRKAQGGHSAWRFTVKGLKPGRNIVSIWPTSESGVATRPVKVTITSR